MSNGSKKHPYEHLASRLEEFVLKREWRQFHSPKNLASCVSVEAGELLELFMWTREGPGPHPPGAGAPEPARVEEEVADIFLSLLNFCMVSGIDLAAAASAKLAALEHKYPVELAKGSAVKSPGTMKESDL